MVSINNLYMLEKINVLEKMKLLAAELRGIYLPLKQANLLIV
ncbi:hypothetical protein ES708_00541 [subsurface metagenome]